MCCVLAFTLLSLTFLNLLDLNGLAFFFKDLFIFMCIDVCLYVCPCEGARYSVYKHSELLYRCWELNSRPSGRTASALNYGVISPALLLDFLKLECVS